MLFNFDDRIGTGKYVQRGKESVLSKWSFSRLWLSKVQKKCLCTHAALSELLGVDGGGKVESPGVVGGRVLPVDEALRSLPDSGSWNEESEPINEGI